MQSTDRFFLWNELEPRCQQRAAGSLELAPILTLQCNWGQDCMRQINPNGFQSLCCSMYVYDFVAIKLVDFTWLSISAHGAIVDIHTTWKTEYWSKCSEASWFKRLSEIMEKLRWIKFDHQIFWLLVCMLDKSKYRLCETRKTAKPHALWTSVEACLTRSILSRHCFGMR